MEFAYDSEWVASSNARALSLSLPVLLDGEPLRGDKIGFYFDNLLPDSDAIRRRIGARFHVSASDSFALLEAIGRDCVGAVQLLPEGASCEGVFEVNARPLEESAVERTLLGVVSEPSSSFAENDDFRISIAGAQEKTAFLWHQGKWCMPLRATPTTHIFKLAMGVVGGLKLDMSASIENEWLCGQILAEYGVPVAPSEIRRFGSTKVLVVTRFDRQLHSSGKYWLRLPQEDFCQATGTPSHLKYESDGGPGLTAIARILQASQSRQDDLATLLRAQLLFWMLAATDGHAKNFSIRLLAQGQYRLSPLYDVLSAWPFAGGRQDQVHPKKLKLAMALLGKNKHYRIDEIDRRHFDLTAQRCGLGRDMKTIIDDVVERTPSVIARVGAALPMRFPEQVFDTVTAGLAKSARRLERVGRQRDA